MGAQTSRHWECEDLVPAITDNGRDSKTVLDSRQAAALSARAKKTASRIAAARCRAEARDRCQAEKVARRSAKKEEMRRQIVEGEVEAQQLKRTLVAAEIERTKRRAREKREEKQAREKRRRRRTHLEGIAWGFDDAAGRRSGTISEESEGCYVSDGRVHENDTDIPEEFDDIGRRTGRRWHRGNTWGVEAGGPGKEVTFEFGVPIDPKKPKQIGIWRRRRDG